MSPGDAATTQSLLEPTVLGSEVDIVTTGIRIPSQECNTSLSLEGQKHKLINAKIKIGIFRVGVASFPLCLALDRVRPDQHARVRNTSASSLMKVTSVFCSSDSYVPPWFLLLSPALHYLQMQSSPISSMIRLFCRDPWLFL